MRRSLDTRPHIFTLILALTSLTATAKDGPETSHAEEVEAWRQERMESLRQPDSWLTLVGLFWLEEGDNTCGSDLEGKVVLPESLPARLGVFHLAGARVEFKPVQGLDQASSPVRHDGQPLTGPLTLQDDTEGEPTLLELGSVTFHVIRRGEKFGVRVKDRESPGLRTFKGLDYFPPHRDWRIEARFEAYDPPRPIKVPTVLGTVSEILAPGAVIFEMAGQKYRLEALPGNDDNELFLIFGDQTNGKETYGGGRFLYANHDGQGRVVVDFNKAYSPPCVFSPYATCPLPPKENRLGVTVTAGEKTYGKH